MTGADVVLSIDPQLQSHGRVVAGSHVAARRRFRAQTARRTAGQSWCSTFARAKSWPRPAPRFDPNWFGTGDPRVEAVLADGRQPLFDRALRMAIPPGSAFKPLTAVALLEHDVVKPDDVFHCQGYLEEPERWRCQIFRHTGVGHGDVTLADALAQSCNVYFFQHVADLGARAAGRLGGPLRLWAAQPANDLTGQSAGRLPTAEQLRVPGRRGTWPWGRACSR